MSSAPRIDAVPEWRARIKRLIISGDGTKAEDTCREGIRRFPNDPSLQRLLGVSIAMQGRYLRAARVLRRLIRQFPRYSRANEELANVLIALNNPLEAITHYERALSISRQPLTTASMAGLKRAVELAASRESAWRVLGEAYAICGRPQEAIEAYETGLEIAPDDGPLLSLLGNELRTVGRQQDAIAVYEKCIALYPSVGEVYYSLANLKNYRFDDQALSAMQDQLDNGSLSDEARVNFLFAAAKAYEDRSDYARAFELFSKGNALRREREPYDAQYTRMMFRRITDVFSPDLIRERAILTKTDSSVTPIFIVGIPRSGSTLLEQILASHSQVEGTHELAELSHVISRVVAADGSDTRFPEVFCELSEDSLLSLGSQYLDATRKYCTGKRYFIDKMPNNFMFVGAIRMMLPQAKIINAMRHPLGTCVSAYKQLFYDGQSYTYNLKELAEYYQAYDELMRHWHTVTPGFVIDVDYQDIVTDLETEVRRILDFCDLPFENSCLSFHETDRPVATASSEQVRQPIYSEALDSWRDYRPHINELIDILAPLIRQRTANTGA